MVALVDAGVGARLLGLAAPSALHAVLGLGLLAEVPFVMRGGRVLKAPAEMRIPTGTI